MGRITGWLRTIEIGFFGIDKQTRQSGGKQRVGEGSSDECGDPS